MNNEDTMEGFHIEPQEVHENTYKKMPNSKFLKTKVDPILNNILATKLKGVAYTTEKAINLTKELAHEIQEELKKTEYNQYKFLTQVIIQQNLGQSSRIASRCLWNIDSDNFTEAVFKNEELIATAISFACYHE